MPTTGKYSVKEYRCTRCGHVSRIGTNHWGECYPSCSECSWKNPMQPMVAHECLEPMPEGFTKPKPWKIVKLGDVAEVVSRDAIEEN